MAKYGLNDIPIIFPGHQTNNDTYNENENPEEAPAERQYRRHPHDAYQAGRIRRAVQWIFSPVSTLVHPLKTATTGIREFLTKLRNHAKENVPWDYIKKWTEMIIEAEEKINDTLLKNDRDAKTMSVNKFPEDADTAQVQTAKIKSVIDDLWETYDVNSSYGRTGLEHIEDWEETNTKNGLLNETNIKKNIEILKKLNDKQNPSKFHEKLDAPGLELEQEGSNEPTSSIQSTTATLEKTLECLQKNNIEESMKLIGKLMKKSKLNEKEKIKEIKKNLRTLLQNKDIIDKALSSGKKED